MLILILLLAGGAVAYWIVTSPARGARARAEYQRLDASVATSRQRTDEARAHLEEVNSSRAGQPVAAINTKGEQGGTDSFIAAEAGMYREDSEYRAFIDGVRDKSLASLRARPETILSWAIDLVRDRGEERELRDGMPVGTKGYLVQAQEYAVQYLCLNGLSGEPILLKITNPEGNEMVLSATWEDGWEIHYAEDGEWIERMRADVAAT